MDADLVYDLFVPLMKIRQLRAALRYTVVQLMIVEERLYAMLACHGKPAALDARLDDCHIMA